MSNILKENFQHLKIKVEDRICFLTLARNDERKKNELNPEFLNEITQAHLILEKDDGVDGVIMSSIFPKYFSNGLDPIFILSQNDKGRFDLIQHFFKTIIAMYSFSKIHFSLIEGHAMAGGAFLGICSDYRYMSNAKGRYCFTEILIGLPIPAPLIQIIKEVIITKYLRQLTLEAKAYKAKEALEIGLVDYVMEPEELVSKAIKDMKKFVNFTQSSLRDTKKNLRLATMQGLEKYKNIGDNDLVRYLNEKAFLESIEKFL